MAEKKNKSNNIVIIVAVAIVATIAIVFAIYKTAQISQKNNIDSAKSPEDIVINDDDSNDIKEAKINKKIELINEKINEIQAKTEPELQKLNKLYEDYVTVLNEYRTPAPVTE